MNQSTPNPHRRLILAGAAATLATFAAPGVRAQADWPNRPVRIIVPFPPGGGFDQIARPLADYLAKRFGQNFLVDNRAGAVGTIGSTQAAKSPNDGYTLLLNGAGPAVTGPMTLKDPPYDPIKDFTHIAMLSAQPNIVIVRNESPFRNMADFIKAAKDNPGKINYGSSGIGAQGHLSAELFQSATGTRLNHVPYKGSSLATTDLMGGVIDVNFDTITAYVPHIKSGRLRGLMVTSRERVAIIPNVPTAVEAGLPDFNTGTWYALSGPAGIAPSIVARLNEACNAFINAPETAARLETNAMVKRSGTAAQYTAFIEAEIKRWGPIVKAAGISAG